jgi:hypothetical protein
VPNPAGEILEDKRRLEGYPLFVRGFLLFKTK